MHATNYLKPHSGSGTEENNGSNRYVLIFAVEYLVDVAVVDEPDDGLELFHLDIDRVVVLAEEHLFLRPTSQHRRQRWRPQKNGQRERDREGASDTRPGCNAAAPNDEKHDQPPTESKRPGRSIP